MTKEFPFNTGWSPIACLFLPHNKGAIPLSYVGKDTATQPWKDKEFYADFLECLEVCNNKNKAIFKATDDLIQHTIYKGN